MKECINCKAILEDDELFCHECGNKQEIEETEMQAEEPHGSNEKKCDFCGKIIREDIAFCPFCGKDQRKEDINNTCMIIPGLEDLVDSHMNYVKDNPQMLVKTNIVFKSNWVIHDLKIITTNMGKTQLFITLDFNKSQEKIIYNRFKQKKYFSLFKSNLSLTNGYEGYWEFDKVPDNFVNTLSNILISVYNYDYKVNNASTSVLSYHILVGDKRVRNCTINNGIHQESKGCLSIIIALIVMGVTVYSLI